MMALKSESKELYIIFEGSGKQRVYKDRSRAIAYAEDHISRISEWTSEERREQIRKELIPVKFIRESKERG
jgi:hypothetical protein